MTVISTVLEIIFSPFEKISYSPYNYILKGTDEFRDPDSIILPNIDTLHLKADL